jgi:hypothetical protein
MPNDDKQPERKSLDEQKISRRSGAMNEATLGKQSALIPIAEIEKGIFLIRAQRVMLDFHLASLYGVATKNLNKAVKRNLDRFPADFMFQLAPDELENLRFQFGTSSFEHGGRRYASYAFTEQGVAMLSSVLKSKQAVAVNIAIIRAFVRLREALSLHKDLAHKLAELEKKIENHDESIRTLFEAMRQLMAPPEKPQKEMGFTLKKRSRLIVQRGELRHSTYLRASG